MTDPNFKRRSLVVLGALALIAGLAGAVYWPSINAWLAPPPPQKLTIATSGSFEVGLLHIAAAQGYFAAEGLAVTLQPHTVGRHALNAVLEQKADIASAGDLPVTLAATRKAPISILATISSSVDSEGVLARRDRGIARPADLKGKTIGVPLGSDAQFLLSVILERHAMAPGDVIVKNLKPEEMTAALLAGRVDAIAVWDPWLSKTTQAAGANGISIFADKGFSFRFHLVGRSEFVRAQPATMHKLLRALLRAEQFLDAQPQAARAVISENSQLDPMLFDALWPNYSLRLTLSQGLLNLLEDQARWAIGNGLTEASEVPNFLDSIYLDAMLAVKPQAVSIVH